MKTPFVSITEYEQKEMLDAIGVSSVEELFSGIPQSIRRDAERALKRSTPFSSPRPEQEVIEEIRAFARKNSTTVRKASFAGGGAYAHFIPSALQYVLSRSEFVTSYTPYQAEIAQGTLQSIFEFQSYSAMLTGMDVANASMYDGATACAEAVLMAMRITGRKRILIAQSLHPHYREVIKTYTQGMDADVHDVPFEKGLGVTSASALQSMIDDNTACFVAGYPNFFGAIEPIDSLFRIAADKKALAVAVIAEAMSTGFLMPPGRLGADITAMECQSFGVPLSFGGPYIGVLASKKAFVRQLPGRLVGQTVDAEGTRAFTLTLSTREQHIRREKATSNICSNEGLLAIAVALYLGLTGKSGLMQAARLNHDNAAYLKDSMSRVEGADIVFGSPFFNEFVVRVGNLHHVYDTLADDGYIPGIMIEQYYPDLKDCLLVAATEMQTQRQMDKFVRKFKSRAAEQGR